MSLQRWERWRHVEGFIVKSYCIVYAFEYLRSYLKISIRSLMILPLIDRHIHPGKLTKYLIIRHSGLSKSLLLRLAPRNVLPLGDENSTGSGGRLQTECSRGGPEGVSHLLLRCCGSFHRVGLADRRSPGGKSIALLDLLCAGTVFRRRKFGIQIGFHSDVFPSDHGDAIVFALRSAFPVAQFVYPYLLEGDPDFGRSWRNYPGS